MEVDSPLEEKGSKQDVKEGKRTKWQLPPSHISVFSNPTLVVSPKSKHSSARQLYSNSSDSHAIQPLSSSDLQETTGTNERLISSQQPMDSVNSVFAVSGYSGSITLEEVSDALSVPKLSRLSTMARAEICPKIKRARLMSTKGVAAKIMEQYGYDISNTTFLYAEETIYLLELGKLEVHLGRVTLSVERARSLLLHSKCQSYPDTNPPRVRSCSVDDYLVYKHLSELGYRVRRRDSDVKISVSQSVLSASRDRLSPEAYNNDIEMNTLDGNLDEGVGCRMELDEEPLLIQSTGDNCQVTEETSTPSQSFSHQSPGIGKILVDGSCQKGTKRKFGELSSDQTPGSTTSSAKDMSDDEYADGEFEFTSNIGDSCMDAIGDNSSLFHPAISNYTVTEADSDVEIDELEAGPSCTNGVHIEEIGHGYDGDVEEDIGTSQEPQPSTSAACFSTMHQQAVVDLADSDTETENLSSFSKVWTKFVPNSTIQIGFPPAVLLPPDIPVRDSIYEFDLKSRESTRSDSELEYYVDELTLNSSPTESDCKTKRNGSCYKTWKEWRQCTLMEARGVLSESLLGQSCMFTAIPEDTMQKLDLWGEQEPTTKRRADEGWRGFNIPYELYHPSVGFTKHKNRKECVPCYLVAVVRNDDEVPSFAACDSLINGIPVLIAVVSDESTIMFMNPDRSPIPSLF